MFTSCLVYNNNIIIIELGFGTQFCQCWLCIWCRGVRQLYASEANKLDIQLHLKCTRGAHMHMVIVTKCGSKFGDLVVSLFYSSQRELKFVSVDLWFFRSVECAGISNSSSIRKYLVGLMICLKK